MPAGVLLVDPKYDYNVGGALRACAVFGAESLLWTGTRVQNRREGERLPREERLASYSHVHWDRVKEEYAFQGTRKSWTPVAVEVREGFESLETFEHPENALYVFGPEDGTLGRKWLEVCHRFIVIPSMIRSPLNLAAAVNVVLYDRYVKWMRDSPGRESGEEEE